MELWPQPLPEERAPFSPHLKAEEAETQRPLAIGASWDLNLGLSKPKSCPRGGVRPLSMG